MVKKLKRGQVIKIKNETHVVIGMIEFKEDTWVWQEYKIRSETGIISWLSVEEDNGKTIYSLYKENYSIPKVDSINFNYQNENYSLFEKGTARVKSYFGSVDVDMNEKVNFTEYINENKDKLISFEDWSGDVERSIGNYVNEADIEITDEIRNIPIPKSSKRVIIFSILLCVITFLLTSISSVLTSRDEIQKGLEKSTDFTYVTSVTNNENNKKAKVYKTNLSVDETVKKIIDIAPESIKKVTDADDDNGIGLFTNYEYAYVYKSEEDDTYVQVSRKQFVTAETSAYHSRYHSRGFYRTYTTNSTNSTYDSYLSSARQQSINSRKSSGGGTSSGK